MKKLENKIALVTGGSRGIGRSIAMRLAEEGAYVIIQYAKRKDEAEKVIEEIIQKGGEGFAIAADFLSIENIDGFFEQIDKVLLAEKKVKKFDILVNNAGIGQILSLKETTPESLELVMQMNIGAPVFVTQKAIERLNDGGRIINLSSFVTRVTSSSVFGYSLSKGAVDIFTRLLAKELGNRNITVNAVQSGIINTEMNKETLETEDGQKYAASLSIFNRWGEPSDVSNVVAFLASEDSCWVTGQLIDVSGGSCI